MIFWYNKLSKVDCQTPGMPSEVDVTGRVPRALKSEDRASDIFCMVKDTMSSKTLSQDPLLVWPAGLKAQSQRALETANHARCPTAGCSLDDARKEELRLLMTNINRDFPHMRRTLQWYQNMVDGVEDESSKGVPPLTFLKDARASHFDWSEVHLGAQRVPPKPHELQVVFHRGWLTLLSWGLGVKKKVLVLKCFEQLWGKHSLDVNFWSTVSCQI